MRASTLEGGLLERGGSIEKRGGGLINSTKYLWHDLISFIHPSSAHMRRTTIFGNGCQCLVILNKKLFSKDQSNQTIIKKTKLRVWMGVLEYQLSAKNMAKYQLSVKIRDYQLTQTNSCNLVSLIVLDLHKMM